MRAVVNITVALRSGFRASWFIVMRIIVLMTVFFSYYLLGLNSVELERILGFLLGTRG